MKTKNNVEFKSMDEAKQSYAKLRSDRDAAMAPFKPETGTDQWKATTAEQRSQWAKMGTDLADIAGLISSENEMKSLESMGNYDEPKKAANLPRGAFGGNAKEEFKSLGQSFIDSNEYKANKGKFGVRPTFAFVDDERTMDEYKSAVVENTFYAPPNYRIPLVVTSAQRPGIIQTIIPTIATQERNAVPYMLETTFTNNAGVVAQTVALTASDIRYTEQTSPIRTVGTYIPVTEQMMEDNTGIAGLINNRLTLMQEQSMETELISGDGTGSHLTGYLNFPSIQSQALGTDDIYTAIAKGLNKVRNTGYVEPDYVVLNSADFLTIRTKKDALGNFIFGAPNLQANEIIWGMPCIITNGIISGTALTGAFKMMSARYIARGVSVEVGRINDNFITLEWAIRITQRETLVGHRGTAFCYVNGLASA